MTPIPSLLLSFTIMMRLTAVLFAVLRKLISGSDIIFGGLFLIAESTREIEENLEGDEGKTSRKVAVWFVSFIILIMLLDIVFSLD